MCEVVDVLINFMGMISQCIHISNHHILHFVKNMLQFCQLCLNNPKTRFISKPAVNIIHFNKNKDNFSPNKIIYLKRQVKIQLKKFFFPFLRLHLRHVQVLRLGLNQSCSWACGVATAT